jgi:hypothetical protein
MDFLPGGRCNSSGTAFAAAVDISALPPQRLFEVILNVDDLISHFDARSGGLCGSTSLRRLMDCMDLSDFTPQVACKSSAQHPYRIISTEWMEALKSMF